MEVHAVCARMMLRQDLTYDCNTGVLVIKAMLRISQKVRGLPFSTSATRCRDAMRGANFMPATIADIISTVEFDHTGNYLATGDKGGRVVLFERNETVSGTRQDFL